MSPKAGSDLLVEAARAAIEQGAQRLLRENVPDREAAHALRARTAAESKRLRAAVLRIARDEGVPASHVYRRAVREYIERYEKGETS